MLRPFIAAMLAHMPLAVAAQATDSPNAPPRTLSKVLVVVAHPDDEIVLAPAIARAAREGTELTIVYATSGDQGPGVSGMEAGVALAEKREGEASCAASALGTGEPRFLRLGDGTLGDMPRAPDSPARRLAAEVGEILQAGDYRYVLTWGPDGGYGHGDHRMVSSIVTQLVQAMPEGRPVLLYPGIRAGTLPPIPELQQWAVTDPALLTVSYGYNQADLAAVRRAVNCHESQFPADVRSQLADVFDASIWQGSVHFRFGLPELPMETPEARAAAGATPQD